MSSDVAAKLTRPDLGSMLDEVYKALFERLDAAFPELGFTKRGNAWTATAWPADFPYEVNDRRPDRLMVYLDSPWRITVHGHTWVRFIDYVNGGQKPVGAEFPKAVEVLCQKAGISFPGASVA